MHPHDLPHVMALLQQRNVRSRLLPPLQTRCADPLATQNFSQQYSSYCVAKKACFVARLPRAFTSPVRLAPPRPPSSTKRPARGRVSPVVQSSLHFLANSRRSRFKTGPADPLPRRPRENNFWFKEQSTSHVFRQTCGVLFLQLIILQVSHKSGSPSVIFTSPRPST